MADESTEAVQTLMDQLKEIGRYEVTEAMKEKAKDFYADYATEEEVAAQIAALYHADGYVIDPHTAVAAHVANTYVAETDDHTPIIIASTASPYKFPQAVLTAIDPEFSDDSMEEMLDRLKELSGVAFPAAIEELLHAEVRHNTVVASGRHAEERRVHPGLELIPECLKASASSRIPHFRKRRRRNKANDKQADPGN